MRQFRVETKYLRQALVSPKAQLAAVKKALDAVHWSAALRPSALLLAFILGRLLRQPCTIGVVLGFVWKS